MSFFKCLLFYVKSEFTPLWCVTWCQDVALTVSSFVLHAWGSRFATTLSPLPSLPCRCWCIQFSTTQTINLLCVGSSAARGSIRLKVTFSITRFGRNRRKLCLSFFFYLFSLSSEDLCSLPELRMSTAFHELWAFSWNSFRLVLHVYIITYGISPDQVSPLPRHFWRRLKELFEGKYWAVLDRDCQRTKPLHSGGGGHVRGWFIYVPPRRDWDHLQL